MTSVRPVFLKDKGLECDNKDISRVAITLCKSACEVTDNYIDGAQFSRDMWKLYPKTEADRVRILANGIPFQGRTIQALDMNPFRVGSDDPEVQGATTKITIRDLPLSACESSVEAFFRQENIQLRSAVKYSYWRDPATRQLTQFRTGDRFCFVQALEKTLPRRAQIGQFKCRLFHPQQFLKPCAICNETGHRPGEPGCAHYMDIPNATTIKSHTNVLSPNYAANINREGHVHKSTMHAFQYCKAVENERQDLATLILDAEHAGFARKLGSDLPPDDDFSLELMESILTKRCRTDHLFKEALRETGQTMIIHSVVGDKYWGSGLDENVSTKVDPNFWPGLNKLGNLLMKIREKLQSENNTANTKERPSRARTLPIKGQRTITSFSKDRQNSSKTSPRSRSGSNKRGPPVSPPDRENQPLFKCPNRPSDSHSQSLSQPQQQGDG